MNADEDELIERYLENRATPEEAAALRQALQVSAETRARYLDSVNLEVALCALADAAAAEERAIIEMPTSRRSFFQGWPLAAAAACVLLALGTGLLAHRKSSRERPDLAAAIESTQRAIGEMPLPPASSLPAWISPTASMLDQPKGFQ